MKRSKYWAKKVVYDWKKFASKLEYEFYLNLVQEQHHKTIIKFEFQTRFILQDWFEYKGKKIQPIYYVSDYVIYHNNWKIDVVDIKWMATTDALLKRKMFLFKYWDKYDLRWISFVMKYWWRVDYFDLQKYRKDARLSKRLPKK